MMNDEDLEDMKFSREKYEKERLIKQKERDNEQKEELIKKYGENIKRFSFFQKLSFEMKFTINKFYGNRKNKKILPWFITAILFHFIIHLSIILKIYYLIAIPLCLTLLFLLIRYIKEYNIKEIVGIIFHIILFIIFILEIEYLLYITIPILIFELFFYRLKSKENNLNIFHKGKLLTLFFYIFYGIKLLTSEFTIFYVILSTAFILALISFFSFITIFYWFWKSFGVIRKLKYPKGEKYDYDPYHKYGSKFILYELLEFSVLGYYFYFLIFFAASFLNIIINLYVFPGVVIFGYFLWLINFIFFMITALPKRLIIKSNDQIEEDFYGNPFYTENLRNSENFAREKCRICEERPMSQIYECGHIFSCFPCWNDSKNIDYRNCCMLCKQISKNIKKISNVNHMYFVCDDFRL